MKTLAIQHIDLPQLLEKEKISGGRAPGYFNYVESFRGISPFELMMLCVLVRTHKSIFELGTYKGIITLHLAENAPKKSMVYTLDLPPEMIKESYIVGEYLRHHIPQCKVVQLYSDSATFIFTP